jgi:hypothetical protein
MWKPRPTWTDLPREQRAEYLVQMETGINKMLNTGTELVGLACNETDVPNDAEYRYFAVWKMPGKSHVHMLERAVRSEGWDHYFEIGNARGQIISVDQAVDEMVCC